jgi:manganese oxidase
MYLPPKASNARRREAERARNNRAGIVKAWSQGQVTRRDLIKWGLFTAGGALLLKNGLSPFAQSAYAQVPTGTPRSPLFGVQPFTTPMPRFDVLPRKAVSTLVPAPTAEANQTQQRLDPALVNGRTDQVGPIEGRPPGPIWAHQRFAQLPPRVAVEVSQGRPRRTPLTTPASPRASTPTSTRRSRSR